MLTRIRPSAVLAVAIAVVAATVYAADLLLLDWFGPFIVLFYANASAAIVGLIIALRRPGHPIGWLFLVSGTCVAVTPTLRAYAWRALVDTPGTLPGGELALWLSTILAPPGSALFAIAALLYPTGRLLSPRWMPLLVLGIVATVAQTVAWGFGPRPIRVPYALRAPPSGPLDALPTIPNPFGLGGLGGEILTFLRLAVDIALVPLFLVCLLAIFARFLRSSGIERLQMKWFAYAAILWIAFLSVAATFRGPIANAAWVLSELLKALVPVAVGIAILRYRLYDIDVLINRTLVYGATTATLIAAYAFTALIAQQLLRPFTQGSELAVAASTLVVAGLIQPVRRRIQNTVDRRFYRSRYDAVRTVDALGLRMRDQVDLDALRSELVDVVRDTMHPTHASVWLRERAS